MASHGQPFSLHVRQSPSQSFKGFVFQAGHASSILVTRSSASLLVNSPFALPQLFEQPDDKNNQAGHMYFMIIGASYTETPCQSRLLGIEIGLRCS
jgi:hypothetical protein